MTIYSQQKVWIVDEFLKWSNLVYLAISRVEYLNQLERVGCPQVDVDRNVNALSNQELRTKIQKKLVHYMRHDCKKGREGFNLAVDNILNLRNEQKRAQRATSRFFGTMSPRTRGS